MFLRISTIAAALLFTAPVFAQDGDVEAGRAIAEEYCARCHDIEDGGAMKTYPPSFDSIAVFRAADQISARVMFPNVHSAMPQWGNFLNSENVADVTAYIVSLE
ncbi:c-type cytochrome [Primorskyibacter sp. 2E233]|uniref:c-type cytochrome n=1 Tax=Primorskyibacter sp. 2E233 TaxID=3413431 RepID=UPI003BF26CD8